MNRIFYIGLMALFLGLNIRLMADPINPPVWGSGTSALTNIPTGQTNLEAGVLVWSGGVLRGGTNVPTATVVAAGGMLSDGSVPMSGTLDMGGNSITNIGTNSLTFMDGTKVSVLSNGVLGVSLGGTNNPKTMVDSGNIATYAPTPPTYYADGPTLLKSGTTFSVQPWITDNLIALRYETWNHWASQTMGLLDGPGYWFSDQNGIRADLSTNLLFSSGYQNAVIGSGGADPLPIYQFKMNDNATDTVLTEMQQGSNLVFSVNTDTMTTNGLMNSALRFDGSTSWALAGANLSATNYTFSFWINTTSEAGLTFLVGGTASSALALYLQAGLILYYTTTGQGETLSTVNDGAWHHIALTRTDGVPMMYIDGVTNFLEVVSGTVDAVGMPITIGRRADAYGPVTAVLDDIRIYDVALTEEQVASVYVAASETYYSSSAVTTNSTVVLTNSLLSFVPGYSFVSALINTSTNAITANNLILSVSRDDGTTWSDGAVTLAEAWSVSNVLATSSITLTNQPAGSNVLVKLTVTNNCPLITVKGMAAPCSQ